MLYTAYALLLNYPYVRIAIFSTIMFLLLSCPAMSVIMILGGMGIILLAKERADARVMLPAYHDGFTER